MVKVMQMSNGQKLITLNKKVAAAYQLKKGDKVKWDYIHKNDRIVGLKLIKA